MINFIYLFIALISFLYLALEPLLAKTSGKFCFGDTLTLADVCLIPQHYNAIRYRNDNSLCLFRWGVDMSPFPTISRIVATCATLEPFIMAHPDAQQDAVKQ